MENRKPKLERPAYAESFRGADHLRRIVEETQALSTIRGGNSSWPRQVMSELIPANHPMYHLLPTGIEGFDSLAELALDMHWSWNHATDEVWRQLDAKLWGITTTPGSSCRRPHATGSSMC